MEHALIISSDGHAMPRMRDYRPYVPREHLDDFDAFCAIHDEWGARPFDRKHLVHIDPELADEWMRDMWERADRGADAAGRVAELDREGIAAEVLYPDFGLPFELLAPASQLLRQHAHLPVRTDEQARVADWVHNRWLADYVSVAPERLAALATVRWDDVEVATAEIRWAKDHGFRGIVLPRFDEREPLFHQRHEPIWQALEDLEMVATVHVVLSSTTKAPPVILDVPHPSVAVRINSPVLMFFGYQMLNHLVWGGVLERHPRLQVVFTELGSAWVVGALQAMDHLGEGSMLRRDHHDFLPLRPSEYFQRQCSLGSSVFSRAEIEARHIIGIDKMMLGMDYPHLESTFTGAGTTEFLRATLGAAGVPADEARRLLGETALDVWGFEETALRPIAQRVGPDLDSLLTPPTARRFRYGDVDKPLAQLL